MRRLKGSHHHKATSFPGGSTIVSSIWRIPWSSKSGFRKGRVFMVVPRPPGPFRVPVQTPGLLENCHPSDDYPTSSQFIGTLFVTVCDSLLQEPCPYGSSLHCCPLEPRGHMRTIWKAGPCFLYIKDFYPSKEIWLVCLIFTFSFSEIECLALKFFY